MFDSVASSIDHIRAGELRPLAVTGATRLDVLPDIPTVGDFVPGYATDAWTGIGAPKNTPAEMIDLLNKEINAALANPRFASRLNDLGQIAFASEDAQAFANRFGGDRLATDSRR
jgi:tripartite-type tricarboxylate transporter receptor subunit TctC